MKPYRIALACLLCLLTHRANSQPGSPVHPVVVRLDSGEVARRAYVAFDTAYYQQWRRQQAADQVQLDLRARRLAVYGQRQRLTDSLAAGQLAESVRERAALARATADFDQLHAQTVRALAQPPRPVLLLDGHFYAGGALGALAVALLFVFLHR